jgi:hypothetical protein
MSYVPRRDSRFDYIWEAMDHIEERQCVNCAFSKLQDPDVDKSHAEEYPMCFEVEADFIVKEAAHEPIEYISDYAPLGLTCNKYEPVGKPVIAPDENQLPLFDS